jgi:pimeloyl-ACP methyl ester carboxylesterase
MTNPLNRVSPFFYLLKKFGMSNTPTIVLVHGAWADGSSWSKVIPILKAAGYNVVATQQNLLSIANDALAGSH